jgi:hypothetical protein
MKPGEHRQPLQSGKTEGQLCFLNLPDYDWSEQKSQFTAANKNSFYPLQEKGGQIYIRHVLSLETLCVITAVLEIVILCIWIGMLILTAGKRFVYYLECQVFHSLSLDCRRSAVTVIVKYSSLIFT